MSRRSTTKSNSGIENKLYDKYISTKLRNKKKRKPGSEASFVLGKVFDISGFKFCVCKKDANYRCGHDSTLHMDYLF